MSGTITSYLVPSGLFTARTQAEANFLAEQFARLEARKYPCCISPIPPYACLNQPYQQAISLNTGEVAANWQFVSGMLPPGITFSGGETSQAILSGTPTVEGSYTFTIGATTFENSFSQTTFNICVTQISASGSLSAMIGTPYEVTFGFATCVTENGTWSLVNPAYDSYGNLIGGPLPPGLTLNGSDGVISGTPASGSAGNYPVMLEFIEAGTTPATAFTCQQSFQISVVDSTPPLFAGMTFAQTTINYPPAFGGYSFVNSGNSISFSAFATGVFIDDLHADDYTFGGGSTTVTAHARYLVTGHASITNGNQAGSLSTNDIAIGSDIILEQQSPGSSSAPISFTVNSGDTISFGCTLVGGHPEVPGSYTSSGTLNLQPQSHIDLWLPT